MIISLLAALMFAGCVNPEENNGQDQGNTDPVKDEFAEVPGGEEVASVLAVNCERVARVIGLSAEDLPNPNETGKRFGMSSTDFGNMWDAGNGSVFCIFGDNFNAYNGDWLSNAVAVSTDRNLADGLYYDSMLWDDSRKKRMEVIHREGYEITCIPTGGFSVTEKGLTTQYVSYMSVKEWKVGGDNDSWSCYHSELVKSDDCGKTWQRTGVKWSGESNFVQVAFEKHDGFVYMWGTKSGRHSQVCLAKVPEGSVLNKGAYQYWNGSGWSYDESAAAPVTNGEVSEMTVRYNSYYKRYIMMYLSVKQRHLVYRDAASPEGEWSAEKIILNGTYGPSIHPWFCDGRDLWFVSSTVTSSPSVSYDTWHIFLYHAKLKGDDEGFNMVWEGGFEDYPTESISYKTLWKAANASTTHDAHSGKNACRLTNTTEGEWKDACTQIITVHKNTDYVLSAFVKGNIEGYDKAYLGARLANGTICDDNPSMTSDWSEVKVEFNSGNNTSIELFFGAWGAKGLQVTIDDVRLSPCR